MACSKHCFRCWLDGLKIWTVKGLFGQFKGLFSWVLMADLRACLASFRSSLRGCFVGILYVTFFLENYGCYCLIL